MQRQSLVAGPNCTVNVTVSQQSTKFFGKLSVRDRWYKKRISSGREGREEREWRERGEGKGCNKGVCMMILVVF